MKNKVYKIETDDESDPYYILARDISDAESELKRTRSERNYYEEFTIESVVLFCTLDNVTE